MKRINFKTAKLAVEKGYPPCKKKFYSPQFTKDGKAHTYSLGSHPRFCETYPALYQAELQEWLRNEHGVSVLIYLDETLSYIWTITGLHPQASIQEFHQSNEVWCGHYEDCLEDGLRTALSLL